MAEITVNINWLAVIVGFIISYGFGALWYSPKMFGSKWMQGVGLTMESKTSTGYAMTAQLVGTFLLAWLIGVTETTDSIITAVLIALTIAVLVKANGLWAGKSKYAITVESGFVLVMVVIMILAHVVF